ncbi:MAG TPA: nucleotidyltransferase family protein [Candidatus Melainabacteria bacterium]|nr:nucleotidyltransferase family protein [Candidatus Melainabacteria bacterium]
MGRKVSAVVLAAGASSRFGGLKQIADFKGQPLIEHVQTVLLSCSIEEVAVVLGCSHEQIAQHILPEVRMFLNEQWKEGIASSVRKAAGFALESGASHLLIFVCDQPFISSCLVDKIVALSKFEPEKVIACRYGDTIGVPALFPASYYKNLLALEGDTGAKFVIKNASGLEIVDFPEGANDVDFRSDLVQANLINKIM